MGIRFSCPNGHKLNVQTFLAGKRGVCPQCGARFVIPVPDGVQASDVRQTVSLAQSQTISPTAVHTTAAAASPSIIIQVADAESSNHVTRAPTPANPPDETVRLTSVTPVAAAPPPILVRPGS